MYFIVILSLCCSGVGAANVVPATGTDPWSKRVAETWTDNTRRATTAFERLAREGLGQRIEHPPVVVVTSSAEREAAARNERPEALVVLIPPTGGIDKQYAQSIRVPVEAYAAQSLNELAAGQAAHVPQWLREGFKVWAGYSIQDSMVSDHHGAWLASAMSSLRKTDKTVRPTDLFQPTEGMEKRRGYAATAVIMVEQLQVRLGDKFLPAVGAYFRAAAAPDFVADKAFAACFGVAAEDFLTQVDSRIQAIRAEVRVHDKPLPPPSGYAALDDLERFPLKGERGRKLYEDYRKARSPKAFALSARGQAASYSSDASDAMARALENCASYDKVSCRLYAVDDEVVYVPSEANHASVVVQLNAPEMDAWARTVQGKWQPLVEQATSAFNQLLIDRTGVGLSETVKMYLVTSQDDYAQTLQRDLGKLKESASMEASISGGLSNGQGQVVVYLPERLSDDGLRERSLKTSLHELTHELQAQLSNRHYHGRAQEWMVEGTADLMAFSVVGKLPGGVGAEWTLDKWHDQNVAWYLRNYGIRPEEVMTTDAAEWKKLMRWKHGPYQMAGLMAEYLMNRCGDDFYVKWANYFRGIGQTQAKESEVFANSFGFSEEEFLAGFKQWLKTL